MLKLYKMSLFWESPLPSERLHLPFLPEDWCQKSYKAKDANKKPKSILQCQHGGMKRVYEVGVLDRDLAFDKVMIHT